MRYFDLHCDTLYKATVENSDFNNSDYHINLSKIKVFEDYNQLFAIWIPDELRGNDAKSLFIKAVEKYKSINFTFHNITPHLAVENASMLASNIENIELLVKNKVKYITLTWNGENELGCGAMCDKQYGLSDFGKDVVKALEKNNISIDISHASDSLFYDVCKVATKPFIATHSNSRSITNNKRNLTDEQFRIIKDIKGIVGLNFYKGFLNNTEETASINDILKHAEHFIKIGGEDVLAIGADFDGADMPNDISGLETVPLIYHRFNDYFGDKLTKKIFFDNANMYFTNFDNN